MSFANTYFKRFQAKEIIIDEQPETDLFLSVVIPVFNEPDLCRSLQSLKDCLIPKKSIELIVVINSAENSPQEIIEQNRKTYNRALEFAERNNSEKIKFHILNFENLPNKFAGVGLARKIGMDEALRRFNQLNKPTGLIAGFDADAIVESNYFIEIEKYFEHHSNINAASIDFQHPVEGHEFTVANYDNITQYELHLRYFVEALRFVNFPFAYHTIGSSFVVKAEVYAKQGGMNKRKAGEDFYFLQKIIQLGNYGEINTTRVIPSPRVSDRVPFGTGAAVKKMQQNNDPFYRTYALKSFEVLKHFFEVKDSFYTNYSVKETHESIIKFLEINKFEVDLINIRKESPDLTVFNKKFYDWFNAFRVIKYLNFAHETYFEKKDVKEESLKLLKANFPTYKTPDNIFELLNVYRQIQKTKKTTE